MVDSSDEDSSNSEEIAMIVREYMESTVYTVSIYSLTMIRMHEAFNALGVRDMGMLGWIVLILSIPRASYECYLE
jgi:hypothetical protein